MLPAGARVGALFAGNAAVMEYQPKVGVVSEAGEGGVRGRLLEDVVRRLRVGHYSLRTERAYLGWIRRFILVNGTRHPRELGRRTSRRS